MTFRRIVALLLAFGPAARAALRHAGVNAAGPLAAPVTGDAASTPLSRPSLWPKRVVVTMSTVGGLHRSANFRDVVSSLAKQTRPPDSILVNIPFSAKANATEGYAWRDWQNDFPMLTVNRVADSGPATKLFGALTQEKDPETVLVVVDDDQLYDSSLVEKLVDYAVVGGVAACAGGEVVYDGISTLTTNMYRHGNGRIWTDDMLMRHYVTSLGLFRGYPDGFKGYAVLVKDLRFLSVDRNVPLEAPVPGCKLHDDVWIGGLLQNAGVALMHVAVPDPVMVPCMEKLPEFPCHRGVGGYDRQSDSVYMRTLAARERGEDPQVQCEDHYDLARPAQENCDRMSFVWLVLGLQGRLKFLPGFSAQVRGNSQLCIVHLAGAGSWIAQQRLVRRFLRAHPAVRLVLVTGADNIYANPMSPGEIQRRFERLTSGAGRPSLRNGRWERGFPSLVFAATVRAQIREQCSRVINDCTDAMRNASRLPPQLGEDPDAARAQEEEEEVVEGEYIGTPAAILRMFNWGNESIAAGAAHLRRYAAARPDRVALDFDALLFGSFDIPPETGWVPFCRLAEHGELVATGPALGEDLNPVLWSAPERSHGSFLKKSPRCDALFSQWSPSVVRLVTRETQLAQDALIDAVVRDFAWPAVRTALWIACALVALFAGGYGSRASLLATEAGDGKASSMLNWAVLFSYAAFAAIVVFALVPLKMEQSRCLDHFSAALSALT